MRLLGIAGALRQARLIDERRFQPFRPPRACGRASRRRCGALSWRKPGS